MILYFLYLHNFLEYAFDVVVVIVYTDGLVARKLNQTSTFGGLLDMVTDRCSTLGLLYVLGGDYSNMDEELGFPVFRCVRV